MALLLIIIGIVGLMGMTWLFPILGRLIRTRVANDKTLISRKSKEYQVSILIPTFNDGEILINTVDSIMESIRYARIDFPNMKFTIHVGLDGCTDDTEKLLSRYGEIEKVIFETNQGKWKTLCTLVDRTKDSDWIAFADAGVLWPNNFLAKTVLHFEDLETMAIAPSYYNPNGGLMERMSWFFERHLKGLESDVGGPVSIHGATIFYRSHELIRTIKTLNEQNVTWLNDDVVIPLMMRTLFSQMKIKYDPNLLIYDQFGTDASSSELKRRVRMVVGNAQWIREVLPVVMGQNKYVGILAFRRVFRTLWAYWGLLIAIPFLTFGVSLVAIAAVGTVASILFVASKKLRQQTLKVFEAFVASIVSPYYIFRSQQLERTAWK